jgi:hypothetical protein
MYSIISFRNSRWFSPSCDDNIETMVHPICRFHGIYDDALRAEAATLSGEGVSETSLDSLPPKLSGADIREKYLAFYESEGHTRMQGERPAATCPM